MMLARIAAGLIAWAACVSPAAPLAAPCDPMGADAADVATARAAVAAACDCAGVGSHSVYVSCASAVVDATLVNPGCRGVVRRCVVRSTCGRPGAVACCRTSAHGATRASIRFRAVSCRDGPRGVACVSPFASVCDACTATGCATLPTTTTTLPPVCGNGIIEGDEQCDGQAACGPGCLLQLAGCCQVGSPPDTICLGMGVEGHFYRTWAQSCAWENGQLSGAVCTGTDPSCPTGTTCGPGICEVASMPPLGLCCQRQGTCSDAVVTNTQSYADFVVGCLGFEPPGGASRVGACDGQGRCVPP
jgi:hypothetical protein